MYSPSSSQASSSVERSLVCTRSFLIDSTFYEDDYLQDRQVRPVVVRQLLDAQQAHTGANFKIDGQEVDFGRFLSTISLPSRNLSEH